MIRKHPNVEPFAQTPQTDPDHVQVVVMATPSADGSRWFLHGRGLYLNQAPIGSGFLTLARVPCRIGRQPLDAITAFALHDKAPKLKLLPKRNRYELILDGTPVGADDLASPIGGGLGLYRQWLRQWATSSDGSARPNLS